MEKSLKRVTIQSGCKDRLMRPIEGIFEVLIDENRINDQMVRAFEAGGAKSTWGAVTVRYQKATKAQADFLVKQQGG